MAEARVSGFTQKFILNSILSSSSVIDELPIREQLICAQAAVAVS
jgi:hypothetical protein